MSMMIGMDRKKALTQILGPKEEDKKEAGGDTGLHSCMQELIDCVHAKDVAGAVEAFKACFQECEMEPHEEYGG